MNSNEILNKYIDLIDKGYCSDCNELNCIDNFPHAKITHAIRELQQENQELKKQLEEYQEELEKADSITQSCIFNGKKESEISFRKCLNMLEKHKNQQKEFINFLEDNYKETQDIWYIKVLQKYKEMIGVSNENNMGK